MFHRLFIVGKHRRQCGGIPVSEFLLPSGVAKWPFCGAFSSPLRPFFFFPRSRKLFLGGRGEVRMKKVGRSAVGDIMVKMFILSTPPLTHLDALSKGDGLPPPPFPPFHKCLVKPSTHFSNIIEWLPFCPGWIQHGRCLLNKLATACKH